MDKKSCCFTGHRDISIDKHIILRGRLERELVGLINIGYTEFIAGGALGFDTFAANCVLGLKRFYPHISLHLVLPCHEQDKKWKYEDKKEYKRILSLSDSYEYVSDVYTSTCMFDRNRTMVDKSSIVIAYYDGKASGGTAMTVRYALKSGLNVINLY